MTPAPGLAAACRDVAETEFRKGMTLERLGAKREAALCFAVASAYHAAALKLEVSR